jgi:hypothetical protein
MALVIVGTENLILVVPINWIDLTSTGWLSTVILVTNSKFVPFIVMIVPAVAEVGE